MRFSQIAGREWNLGNWSDQSRIIEHSEDKEIDESEFSPLKGLAIGFRIRGGECRHRSRLVLEKEALRLFVREADDQLSGDLERQLAALDHVADDIANGPSPHLGSGSERHQLPRVGDHAGMVGQ